MADRTHNYDYPVDIDSETAAAKVVRFVGDNKRVLEIGCGPGSITRILYDQNQCSVTGIELDQDAIRLVAPYCDRVISADLNNTDWNHLKSELGTFETIVAADVLEHLYDPWKVLSDLRTLLKIDGEIVISLPHVGHAAIAACLVSGSFEYRDWGLLDRTHIRFFGLKDIDSLFSEAGLTIIQVGFVITPPEETEFAPVWASMSPNVKKALKSPAHSEVYQVVVKAIKAENPVKAISICETIKSNQTSLKRPATLRARLLGKLTDKQKIVIRGWISKI